MIITEVGGFDDRYYYTVGDRKTVSRNQALIWAKGDVRKIHFYCLETTWSTVDWSTEPTQSMHELCLERCRQIRGSYDWICLWLSSGYDSQTVLQSFIDSQVPLDEIAYMDRSDYYNDPELPYILDTIRYYKKYHNPDLKIFNVKIDYNYTKNLYQKLDEWFLEPGICMRLSKSIAPFVHRFNEDVVSKRTSTLGRRADIYGKEKPTLDLYENKWYMRINDLTYGDSVGADIVGFFTTPDMPKLHVKQCYQAIKFFESLENCNNELVHNIQSNNSLYYQRWNLSLGRKRIGNHISRHGINKHWFTQSCDSPDGQKILKHLSKENNKILDFIQDSIHQFNQSIGYLKPLTPIMGKSWYICDYGRFSTTQISS